MSTDSDREKAVIDYIKASLPILSDENLEETADAVLKEARKRKKKD